MEGSSSLVVESSSHGKGISAKEKQKKVVSGRGSELPVGSISCIDCGNQAKKECSHRRCRTCCTGRSLPCPTHVKSTWVPAAKRRERQMGRTDPVPIPPKRTRNGTSEANTIAATATATAANINNGGGGASSISSGVSPKAPEVYSVQPLRVLPPPSQPPTAPSFAKDESSGCGPPPLNVAGTEKLNKHAMSFEAANLRKSLPSELRAQALFKCVIVTGLNDEKNEYAYQTSVKIGGHIFRGMLYDQGIDAEETNVQVGEKVVSSSFFHNSEAYGSSGNNLKGSLRKVPIQTQMIVKWWENFGASTPQLQQLAIRVLSRRNRLKPTNSERLVFIYTNLRLLDKTLKKGFEIMDATCKQVENELDVQWLLALVEVQQDFAKALDRFGTPW